MARNRSISLVLAVFLLLCTVAPTFASSSLNNSVDTANLSTNYEDWINGSTFEYHPNLAKTAVYEQGFLVNTVFELRNAYDLNRLYSAGYDGEGQTIVIVDAYGSPTIYEDFLSFILWQNAYGANLPWTTIAEIKNHLRIYYPMGKPAFNANDPEHLLWSTETTLDVDMVHAIAPEANIALVIAPNSNNRPLDYAVFYSIIHRLGCAISLSWGEPESSIRSQGAIRQAYTADAIYKSAAHAGITIFASSGDWGASNGAPVNNPLFPSSDPYITAVGGTNLFMKCADGFKEGTQSWDGQNHIGISYSYEIAGNDYQAMTADGFPLPFDAVTTGGAMSSLFALPSWQKGIKLTYTNGVKVAPTGRCTADISFNSGVYGGLGAVFLSAASPGSPEMTVVGGTSAGSPFWAALTAIACQYVGHNIGYINPQFYEQKNACYRIGALNDITSGDNTYPVGNILKGYKATKGWDSPTGLGSPNGAVFVFKIKTWL